MSAINRKPVVLCVDDEPKILKSLKRILERDSYVVHTCTSGVAAINFLEQSMGMVDLLISDMRMPEMTGAELLQRISMRWPNIVRVLLTGYSDVTSTISAINHGHIFSYIQKPWKDPQLLQTLNQAWHFKKVSDEREYLQRITEEKNLALNTLNNTLETKVQQRTADLSNTVEKLETANFVLQNQHMSSIRFMANMLENRNSSSSGHARFVSELGLSIAEKIQLSEKEQENLYHAALIHDIGLISLPDQILETSYARLHEADRKRYENHSILGEKLLSETPELTELGKIIRQHHECFDGSGYPDGASGDEISNLAQIIAIASDYQELQNGKLLSQRLKPQEAQEYLISNAGKRYAFDLVRVTLEAISEYRPGVSAEGEAATMSDEQELKIDIYTPQGVLLLAKGTRLNRQLSQRLEQQTLRQH